MHCDATLANIEKLSDTEKMQLVRDAIYSDEHLFKVLFRIALIADPGNTDASVEWIKARISSFRAEPE